MRLRRLEIQNFRGIKSLDWKGISATAALVGPGDSCKSTILEAIERILSPRWNVLFDDADFWDLSTKAPIVVRATITDVPEVHYQESKFGLAMQGFDEEEGEAVPTTGDDEESLALVLELRVEASLEPRWSVLDGEGQPHPITAKDRELFGMLRVGGTVDPHLGWGRGSVLTRLTEGGDEVGSVLADAGRQARAGLKRDNLDRLCEAARSVEKIGKGVGVAPKVGYAPHLDVGSVSVASGALSLHDGEVPLRRAGLGTRRLLAVGMQRHVASGAGLTIIDEFEQGLEPHRIRRLLRVLRGRPPEEPIAAGQLVLTTHSPTVIAELSADEIWITAREGSGDVRVRTLPEPLAYILPRTPEALLARKVVVTEGATEEGLCDALDESWTENGSGASFAYLGVAVVDGGGSTQPAEVAGALVKLGYTVGLLVDSDGKAKTSRAKGAKVLAWADGSCTEQRLAADLPREGIAAMLHVAVHGSRSGPRSIRDALADECGVRPDSFDQADPSAWIDAIGLAPFRKAFGDVAKRKDWFKTFSLGRKLGKIVVDNWDALKDTPTRAVLDGLRSFAHDDDQRG